MSRACAAKLVTKSRVGGEPAIAARMVPPCAGHLPMLAPDAPVTMSIETSTAAEVISVRTIELSFGSMTQPSTEAGGHDVFLPLAEPEGIEGEASLAHPSLVEMDRGHALAELARDLGGPRRRRENHLHEGHAPRRLARDEHRLHARQAPQRGGEAPAALRPFRLVLGLAGHECVESGHGARDLLLAHLEAATEAVARHAVEGTVHELLGRGPGGGRNVHVHLLQERGGDELAAPEKEPARLRTAEGLAATHADEIGAIRDEATQILDRRHLVGGVYDHGQLLAVRHLDYQAELRAHTLHRHVGHGHRARADARLDLLRFDLAHAPPESPVEESHLDETGAGHLEGFVVGVPLVTADHDLRALLPPLVRHAIDAPHVEPRDAGARSEGQRAEGARGDERGLGAGVAGDGPARRLLQLLDGHRALRRLAHGLERLGAHDRAAEPGQGARSVHHGPHPEPIVDGHPPPLSRRARSTVSAISVSTAP